MKNVTSLLLLWVFVLPVFSLAIEPSIIERQKLNFGSLLHFTGSCEMDYLTTNVTDLAGSNICMFSTTGNLAKYRIFTNPNSTVNIQVNQKLNTGDGIRFVPTGLIITTDISFQFSSNFNYVVNSGDTGVIDVEYGGRLYVESELTPNTVYQFDMMNGLDWSVVP